MSDFDTILLSLGKKSPEQIEKESRDAFMAALNEEQYDSWHQRSSFVVTAKNGINYAVTMFGTIVRQDKYEVYFLRIRGVSLWDSLLIKKGWLENAPEEILARAQRLEFESTYSPDKLDPWAMTAPGPGAIRPGSIASMRDDRYNVTALASEIASRKRFPAIIMQALENRLCCFIPSSYRIIAIANNTNRTSVFEVKSERAGPAIAVRLFELDDRIMIDAANGNQRAREAVDKLLAQAEKTCRAAFSASPVMGKKTTPPFFDDINYP